MILPSIVNQLSTKQLKMITDLSEDASLQKVLKTAIDPDHFYRQQRNSLMISTVRDKSSSSEDLGHKKMI